MSCTNSNGRGRGIFSALGNNSKPIADASQILGFIMDGIATLFIAIGLLVGVVVMCVGILTVSIWCFLFMLNYLS